MIEQLRRRRARRGQGELLREEILRAAADLLAETGEEAAVSIRSVAERVGVTPPSIYLHFPDKEAMLGSVCELVFAELDERMEAAGRDGADLFDSLRRRGMAYIEFALDRPEHYRFALMRRSATPPPSDEVLTDAVFTHHLEAVAACQRAGVFRGGDPAPLAIALWAAAHGIASLMIAQPWFPWPPREEIADLVIRMAGLGLAANSRLLSLEPGDVLRRLDRIAEDPAGNA